MRFQPKFHPYCLRQLPLSFSLQKQVSRRKFQTQSRVTHLEHQLSRSKFQLHLRFSGSLLQFQPIMVLQMLFLLFLTKVSRLHLQSLSLHLNQETAKVLPQIYFLVQLQFLPLFLLLCLQHFVQQVDCRWKFFHR